MATKIWKQILEPLNNKTEVGGRIYFLRHAIKTNTRLLTHYLTCINHIKYTAIIPNLPHVNTLIFPVDGKFCAYESISHGID